MGELLIRSDTIKQSLHVHLIGQGLKRARLLALDCQHSDRQRLFDEMEISEDELCHGKSPAVWYAATLSYALPRSLSVSIFTTRRATASAKRLMSILGAA